MSNQRDWYLLDRVTRQPKGPMTDEQIAAQIRSGEVALNEYVWGPHLIEQRWLRLLEIPEFAQTQNSDPITLEPKVVEIAVSPVQVAPEAKAEFQGTKPKLLFTQSGRTLTNVLGEVEKDGFGIGSSDEDTSTVTHSSLTPEKQESERAEIAASIRANTEARERAAFEARLRLAAQAEAAAAIELEASKVRAMAVAESVALAEAQAKTEQLIADAHSKELDQQHAAAQMVELKKQIAEAKDKEEAAVRNLEEKTVQIELKPAPVPAKKPAFQEQGRYRRFPRAPMETEVIVHDQLKYRKGRCVDISENGVFVQIDELEAFSKGGEVIVTLRNAPILGTFSVSAAVVRIVSQGEFKGVALSFLRLNPNIRRLITKFVLQHLRGEESRIA